MTWATSQRNVPSELRGQNTEFMLSLSFLNKTVNERGRAWISDISESDLQSLPLLILQLCRLSCERTSGPCRPYLEWLVVTNCTYASVDKLCLCKKRSENWSLLHPKRQTADSVLWPERVTPLTVMYWFDWEVAKHAPQTTAETSQLPLARPMEHGENTAITSWPLP